MFLKTAISQYIGKRQINIRIGKFDLTDRANNLIGSLVVVDQMHM